MRSSMSSMTSMPCGPPKPRKAVCEVLCVRQTQPVALDGRQEVGVVDVEDARATGWARRDRGSSRRRNRVDMRAPSRRPSSSKPGVEARQEGMALAGERHVERARQAHAHGPPRLPRAERGDGGPGVGLHFLAAEGAAHAEALHGDLLRGDAEHARDDLLRLGWDAAWRSATATPPDSSSQAMAHCVSR